MPGMPMPQQEHAQHQEMNMEAAKPLYPKMRRAQESSRGNLVTLEGMQKLAKTKIPRSGRPRARFAPLARGKNRPVFTPNPTVGYAGDEIRGGSVGGGKQGFFVQQSIVTGNKLGLSRDVHAKICNLPKSKLTNKKSACKAQSKMAYLRVLAAQELLDTRNDIARIASRRR